MAGITYLDEPEQSQAKASGGVSYLDDEPKKGGISYLDDEPQGPAPEGMLASFLRPIGRYLPSSLATAAGGIGGATLGGLAGTPELPIVGTAAGAIAGDIAGGVAAGAAAEKARSAIMGDEALKAEEAQLAANEQANPWSSKIGSMVGQLPAFLGGGTGLFKEAKAAAAAAGEKFAPTVAQAIGEQAKGGARMLGSEEAGKEATGQAPVSWGGIPAAIAQGAITMGPLGFVSKIPGLAEEATGLVGKTLQTAGHAAGSSEILAHSNALFNSVVNGQPYNEAEVQKTALSDIPAFALMGAAGHLLPKEGAKAPAEGETPPVEPIVPPKTAETVTLATDAAQKLKEIDPNSPTAAVMEQTAHESASKVAENLEKEPEIQPLEENAVPIEGAGEVLQREPEQVGGAGGERGGVEQVEQGPETPEPQPPPIPPVKAQTPEVAEPPPDSTKIKDYDEHGFLKAEAEIPHDEAIRKLSIREDYLKKLRDCIGRAA